jgi:uncharacterized protein YmfQ (DUF2313 family)
MTPDLRAPDFLAAYHALMPRGAAWSREPGTVLDAVLSAMAARSEAFQARVVSLGDRESFPPAATELLGEWERSYGLPDECGGAGDSLEQRRAALLARIAETGGQSRAYFIAVAAALGFTVTITEFRPARIGLAAIGDPIQDEPWLFTWRMNAPETTVTPARIGLSAVGDPLQSFGNARLECAIGRIKPAHTTVLFAYS